MLACYMYLWFGYILVSFDLRPIVFVMYSVGGFVWAKGTEGDNVHLFKRMCTACTLYFT